MTTDQVRAFSIWQARQAEFIRWGPMAHVPRYTADGQESRELSADEIWKMAEQELVYFSREGAVN